MDHRAYKEKLVFKEKLVPRAHKVQLVSRASSDYKDSQVLKALRVFQVHLLVRVFRVFRV